MVTYANLIKRAMKHAKENQPPVALMSDNDLRERARQISAFLTGPGIPAGERLILNEERKAYRAETERRAALSGDPHG